MRLSLVCSIVRSIRRSKKSKRVAFQGFGTLVGELLLYSVYVYAGWLRWLGCSGLEQARKSGIGSRCLCICGNGL